MTRFDSPKVDVRVKLTEYTLDALEDAAQYYRSDVPTLIEKAINETLARHDRRMDEIEDFGGWQPAPVDIEWRTRTKKTSTMSPLRIAEIPLADGYGNIGITLCPGKRTPPDDPGMSGPWDRDLATDLDEIKEWGAAAVLSLIERHEMESLQVPHIGLEVVKRDMRWYHLPIPDHTAPNGSEYDDIWRLIGPDLRALLRSGKRVLIHCRGGIGRAGTMAARLIVELGVDVPVNALLRVRMARPGACENACQERHVLESRPVNDEEATT